MSKSRLFRKSSGKALVAFIAGVLLMGSVALSAQVEKGVVTGVVKEASGGVLSNAQVSLTSVATKIVTTTASDQQGIYVSPPLDPGDYEVKITAPDLAPAVRNVRLEVAQRIRVDVVLTLPSLTQTVQVSAATVQFDTETSTLSNLRTEKAVHDLPLNGRNFAELLGLGAGVVPGQSQITSSIPYVQQRGATSYGVNGLRMTDNRLLLDGIGDNENHNGLGVIIFPPIDAVEEFREETSNPDARYGRFRAA